METKFGHALKENAFLLDPSAVFLNHGSYGTVPRVVYEKQCKLKEEMERHPDTWYRRRNAGLYRHSLDILCSLIGSQYSNTVFVENATTGLNAVVHSLEWKQGDIILLSNITYHAVHVMCKDLAKKFGIVTKTLELKFPLKNKEDILKIYEEALSSESNIKLAIIDHITSPSSVVLPVKELSTLCHQHNVMVLIDGAHALGHIKLNVPDIGADFYSGNVHKWFFTPRGCGYLWVDPSYTSVVKPSIVSHFHGLGLHQDFCVRGTRDDTAYYTIEEAVHFCNNTLGGWDAVYDYNTRLLANAVADLTSHWKTGVLEMHDELTAPFLRLVRVPEMNNYPKTPVGGSRLESDLFTMYNIQTLCMEVQGELYFRLSAHVYNSQSDYTKLRDAVMCLVNQPQKEVTKQSYDLPIMHWDLSALEI